MSGHASLLEEIERKDRQIEALQAECAMLREALEEFKLGHEHAPDLPHTRAMGDSYGWCDYCLTKVTWGPGIAEQALSQTHTSQAAYERMNALESVAKKAQGFIEHGVSKNGTHCDFLKEALAVLAEIEKEAK